AGSVAAVRPAAGSAAVRRASIAQRAVQEAVQTRDGLALAVAHLVGARTSETIGHLRRLRFYCRILGAALLRAPEFTGKFSDGFLQTLEACVPLHDIGMAALPD